jgi:hypothetical protein
MTADRSTAEIDLGRYQTWAGAGRIAISMTGQPAWFETSRPERQSREATLQADTLTAAKPKIGLFCPRWPQTFEI